MVKKEKEHVSQKKHVTVLDTAYMYFFKRTGKKSEALTMVNEIMYALIRIDRGKRKEMIT